MATLLSCHYHLCLMNHDVTQLLSSLGQVDPHAASRLLPLVYEELRKLAAQRPRGGVARGRRPRTRQRLERQSEQ
jgi:ECF sigma factor